MTVLNSSLLVPSQNAGACDVPKRSNFSMQGCPCAGETQFQQLARLIAEHRPSDLFPYLSEARGQQKGMGVNLIFAFGQHCCMLFAFMKPTPRNSSSGSSLSLANTAASLYVWSFQEQICISVRCGLRAGPEEEQRLQHLVLMAPNHVTGQQSNFIH